jgi:two-component system, OmpR family, heavy metal sensor histidine kinase CusS
MMRSLRSQLLIGASLAACVVLLGSSLLTWTLICSALNDEFDVAVLAQARAVAGLATRDGKRLRIVYDAQLLPEYSRLEKPDVFCFRDRHGVVILRSPALIGGDLPQGLGAPQNPMLVDIHLPDGRPARAATFSFTPRPVDEDTLTPAEGHALMVSVARDTIERDHRLAVLGWILFTTMLIGTLAAFIIMWWLSGRLLRPVQALARRIAAIRPQRLSERLSDLQVPSELTPVIARLDDLLARLEEAFARERAFTADAAHELRTPLAGLRTALEVALSRDRSAAEYRSVLIDGLEISGHLQVLIDNLLAMARVEAGHVRVEREPTDVATFIRSIWDNHAAAAHEKQLHSEFSDEKIGDVALDRAKLRLVLTNVFDNAISYTDVGGDLRIATCISNQRLIIVISNSGCTLSGDAIAHVFDRFWRGDSAHSAVGTHCGLGLALCRSLMSLQEGAISATIHDGRFTITIELPIPG